MSRKTPMFIFGFLMFLLISCKTYYIPKESFLKQFDGIDSSKLVNVSVQGPMGTISQYMANPLTTIKCLDKKGNGWELTNSPSIETRITINNRKRVLFYFDRLVIEDSVLPALNPGSWI